MVWFLMILDGPARNLRYSLIEELTNKGIASRPIVAGNFTRNPVMKYLPHSPLSEMPNADVVHDHGLFVGNHHYKMENEFDLLDSALRKFKKINRL